MLDDLKKEVYRANMELEKYKLITFTWGNVSGIDHSKDLIVIKPSGVPYEDLEWGDMVIVDMEGNRVRGNLNPSSDTPTHIELYKKFPKIGGVVHTHSRYATCFAQALKGIKALGTTHADYFYGDIPCTRILTKEEVLNDYEKNTGLVIAETFKDLDENAIPGVLVANHGPFTWGKNAQNAVFNAVVLEEIANMAINTQLINGNTDSINQYILDKHYLRKHGENAYYGQNKR